MWLHFKEIDDTCIDQILEYKYMDERKELLIAKMFQEEPWGGVDRSVIMRRVQ